MQRSAGVAPSQQPSGHPLLVGHAGRCVAAKHYLS